LAIELAAGRLMPPWRDGGRVGDCDKSRRWRLQ